MVAYTIKEEQLSTYMTQQPDCMYSVIVKTAHSSILHAVAAGVYYLYLSFISVHPMLAFVAQF